MAQKGNLITLRKRNNIELITQNTKIWASLFVFVENIGRLFFVKGVWVLKSCCGFDTNLVSINFSLYYQTFKIALLKKKLIRTGTIEQEGNFNHPIFIKNRCLSNLFTSYKQALGYNYFNFNFVNLNNLVNKRKLVHLYKALKMFSFNIFTRRYNLFIDFLKITILFLDNHISLSGYIKIWVLIFKNLHKRLHGKFFLFVRKTIEVMLKIKKSKKNKIQEIQESFFSGAKFILSGRIRGKPRSSSTLICLGRVPTQSIKKKVEFASSHVYTLYGVYGIKMWTFFDTK